MSIKEENQKQIKYMCQFIKKLRKEKNITIEELAHETQIPVSILNSTEHGIISDDFTIDMLFELCKYFNLKPVQMFTCKGDY